MLKGPVTSAGRMGGRCLAWNVCPRPLGVPAHRGRRSPSAPGTAPSPGGDPPDRHPGRHLWCRQLDRGRVLRPPEAGLAGTFLELPHGTFGRIFGLLDPAQLEALLQLAWVAGPRAQWGPSDRIGVVPSTHPTPDPRMTTIIQLRDQPFTDACRHCFTFVENRSGGPERLLLHGPGGRPASRERKPYRSV